MSRSRDSSEWIRQPIVWLGAAVLCASILACVTTIILAWQHADIPIDTAERSVMKVPLRHSAPVPPSTNASQ